MTSRLWSVLIGAYLLRAALRTPGERGDLLHFRGDHVGMIIGPGRILESDLRVVRF